MIMVVEEMMMMIVEEMMMIMIVEMMTMVVEEMMLWNVMYTNLFIHLFIYLSISTTYISYSRPSIYLSIYPSIYPFIHHIYILHSYLSLRRHSQQGLQRMLAHISHFLHCNLINSCINNTVVDWVIIAGIMTSTEWNVHGKQFTKYASF